MKNYLLIGFLTLAQVVFGQFKTQKIGTFKSMDSSKAVLVDVRTPSEFREGHLEGAVNMDWLDPSAFGAKIKDIPKNKVVYVYCKAGGRSLQAAQKLDSLGYQVINLSGGYDAWTERQRP
tara:strand:+ start:76574 stop:76933 length:360 start_codon:yes stop_codon:yes gene_type:complete